jgi:hypothetical protein
MVRKEFTAKNITKFGQGGRGTNTAHNRKNRTKRERERKEKQREWVRMMEREKGRKLLSMK